MSENMALLSQTEIDALVEFLTAKTNVNGEVLDQNSIDKLVNMLQDSHFVKKMGLLEPSAASRRPGVSQALLLEEEGGLLMQQENCVLLFEPGADGMVQIVCQNRITGRRHLMRPSCLEALSDAEEDSSWGRAVSPLVFDNIAALLQVKYTRATFYAVCERFAEVVYGNKTQALPALYMPNGVQLMLHMLAGQP